MKTMLILIACLLVASIAWASPCELPAGLQLGKAYQVRLADTPGSERVVILSLDKNCWVAAQSAMGTPMWINLGAIDAILADESPGLQGPKPGNGKPVLPKGALR
jgi:hypothetical protein